MTELGFMDRVKTELNHWRRRSWSFQDVGDHWDDTEDYDEINEETYSYFRRFIDGYRLSNLQDNGRVLDFCSRTGNGTLYFHERGKISSAYCADVSFRMGAICKKRLEESGIDQHLWVPVWQYALPFSDESFDSILCFETVEHFPKPALLIAELGRLAKPGAQLILTTPNILWEPVHALAAILKFHHSEGPHRFIPFRSLKRMVRQAGFNIDRIETTVLIPGGPAPLVNVGEWLESRTRHTLMPILGLRRVIVATKK